MSYQVIARKYRPQKFEEVVGQDHVTRTLRNAIDSDRIAHAYLFVGPRGTGKTTIARIFSKCLNCQNGPSSTFADDDPRCQEIAEGRSLDVMEIDGASNRGIEEIRDLRETVKYAPSSSKFKIYIIDEVHMLTKEAFNALLKTLEEPPAHVKFMFATTEPEKLPNTILSRCQRFDLRRIPGPLMAEHLAKIAELESVEIEPQAIQAILRGSEGCMRDAESILDQLISFCGSNITEADALSVFGLTGEGELDQLAEAILVADRKGLLTSMHRLAQQGKDLGKAFGDLIQRLHEALTLKISGGDSGLLENTSELSIDRAERLAELISVEGLTRALETLTQREPGMSRSSAPRVYLEISLFQALQAAHSVSLDEAFRVLRTWKTQGAPPPDFVKPRTSVQSEAQPSASPAVQPETSAEVVESNPEITESKVSNPTQPSKDSEKQTPVAKQTAKRSSGESKISNQEKTSAPDAAVEPHDTPPWESEDAPGHGELKTEPQETVDTKPLSVIGDEKKSNKSPEHPDPTTVKASAGKKTGKKKKDPEPAPTAAAEQESAASTHSDKTTSKGSERLEMELSLDLPSIEPEPEDKPNLADENIHHDLETLWAKLVDIAGPLRRASMSVGRPLSMENNVLTVGFYNDDAHQLEIADDQSFKRAALKKMRSEGLKEPKLRFIRINEDRPADFQPILAETFSDVRSKEESSDEGKVSAGGGRKSADSNQPKTFEEVEPVQMDPEDFKNDPQIKTALELFNATLIDVKP